MVALRHPGVSKLDEILAEADKLHRGGQYAAAIVAYRRVLDGNANLFEACYGLGLACESILEYGEAVAALRQALILRPDEAHVRVNFGKVLFGLGHVSEAIRQFQRAAQQGEKVVRELASANIACLAPGDPALNNRAVMEARRHWAQTQGGRKRPKTGGRRMGERLRIGYYGSFFASKNWMKMYMGTINAHDRERFEVNLIVDGPIPCAEAGYRDHPNDRVWQVDGVSNEELAGHIAAAEIDVLIDLNGYSHQMRMPLLNYRAAPVQIAWNGMYGTTGFAAVDCVIGDASSIPVDEERFCVERVRRVRHTYLPFHMFYDTPDVAPPPCLGLGHVTFGSLNSAYKITAPVIAAWARILSGVPGARLLLRNQAMDCVSNRADVLARFAANGIEAARLTLEGSADHLEFLRTYDRIDIALDTFPYNGGTTTVEAIWQGVPVLTFNGDRWASRTSRSILRAAGLGTWDAPDQAEFEAMAVRMARSPETLAQLRATQRARVAASPACDTVGLCRELEAIYLEEAGAKL